MLKKLQKHMEERIKKRLVVKPNKDGTYDTIPFLFRV